MSDTTLFHTQLNWIDAQKTAMLRLLIEWADINSSSDNLEGLARMQAVLKKAFSPLGGEVEELSIPSSQSIDHTGKLVSISHGKALRIRKRPHAKKKIFLAGHMDTVYPAHHPFQKAKQTSENVLNGPGVADMKGGLVIMLKALEALEQHPASHSLGWEVLITSDEEIGSKGSESLFLDAAKNYPVGLIYEPSFSDGAIVGSRKGSSNFTVTAKGIAAHAGRDFEKGNNAIVSLAEFLIGAHRLSDLDKGITVNIGRISGGGPLNVVPDSAVCGLNIRATSAQDFQEIQKKLQQLVDNHNHQGASLTLYAHHAHPPKIFDDKNQQLFARIEQCALYEGYPLSIRPSGGACDGNLLSAAGMAVIDTLGAIGGNIHSPEEYILIDSLSQRARLSALFLLKIAEEKPHD